MAASCGRLGFNDHPTTQSPSSGTPDAPIGSPTQPDAPGTMSQLLTCGSPTRFAITTDNNGFASAPRTNGFGVFDVDSQGALWGWSYSLDDSGLVTSADSIQMGSNTNASIGGAAIGDQFVVAGGNGSPATGTTLYAFDSMLKPIGSPSARSGEFAGQIPLAVNGSAIAYATTAAAGDADIRLVDANGNDASSVNIVGVATEMPSYVAVVATSGGFALGYADGNSGRMQIATFDSQLDVVAPPTTVDGGTYMESPLFAYSPTLDEFAVAFDVKDETEDDDAWAMIVDHNMNVVVAPFEVAPFSTNAVIAADSSGFWIAYNTYDPTGMQPDAMASSHIDASGTVLPRTVTSSGGSPASWQLIDRDGQVVLVWAESGGNGPNLYFDPMCGG
jgi:hypothetical protein